MNAPETVPRDNPSPSAAGTRWVRAAIPLLFLLLAINAMAIWGILSAREEAEKLAREDLRLKASAEARSLESALATLRGDFLFLTQSPPMSRALTALGSSDPMTSRWGRLDVEGALILFLESHPSVLRILVRDADGHPLEAVGRQQGIPLLLSAEKSANIPFDPARTSMGIWKLGGTGNSPGTVESILDPEILLAPFSQGTDERILLTKGAGDDAGSESGGEFTVRLGIADDRWSPPIYWTLVRTESRSHLVESVGALASSYRTTVVLDVTVMVLALLLGFGALRQSRRAALAEAERRHQEHLRELERQLMHNERLVSIGRLAAGMAHEINNPLEGMANYLSLLEEDLRTGDGSESLELAARVREGLDRAAGIVRQALMQADPGRGVRGRVDLNEVIEGTIEFVRKNPSFRHVEIAAAPPPGESIGYGNAVTLSQLVLNLLLNACESAESAGRVDVAWRTEGDFIRFIVSDRGPGIPKEAFPRLFEPFFSTRGSTGLGLAVCHRIVTDHSGKIRAMNRDGGGASFEVEIPTLESGTRRIADSGPPSRNSLPARVLIPGAREAN